MEKAEAEYWISVGMYLAHGFHLMSTVFAAEQMDEEANVPVTNGDEAPAVN